MKAYSLRAYLVKMFVKMFAPLAVLLLIAFVPVSRAADFIPESVSKPGAVDTIPPDDVENVKVTAGDGSATMTWDVATDNVGVKGYKVYYDTKSVGTEKGKYDLGFVNAGNKITYTFDKLTNGTKYYFAVTAYDAAGNESVNYSIEVSATPIAGHGAADKNPLKVTKTEAVDKSHVRVLFSEAVKLPLSRPESAFNIKNDTTSARLEVKDAVMDKADLTGRSVLLATVDQQAGASYILTAGIDIKSLAGNPIISGTSDTAIFTGTDLLPAAEQKTTQAVTQRQTQAAVITLPPAKEDLSETAKEPAAKTVDNVAPEDVTNFTAKMLKKLIVTLNWTKSLNSAGDLANYVLYMATTEDQYGDGIAINPAETNFDVTSIIPGVKYFFKLTAKNNAGNESNGVTANFILPETGPELLLLLFGSLGAGRFLQRRRKK